MTALHCTHPYYTHDSLGKISSINRLYECVSVIYEGEKGHTGRGLSDPVQEAVLSTEHSGGPDDDLQEVMTARESEYQYPYFQIIEVQQVERNCMLDN